MNIKRTFSIFPILLCIWGILVFAITEGLSFFMSLTKWGVRVCWVVIGVVAIALTLYFFKKNKQVEYFKQHYLTGAFLTEYKADIIFWSVVFALMIPVFYLARNVVPNNYDSMVYHLPRIMNWMQNKTVDYYPTNSCRQVISPVLTEYAQMHFYWLLGGDQNFCFVQYLSYVINAILIGQICNKVKLSRLTTYLTIVLYITMPVCIAESITTQVDLFGTMWLLVFVDIVIDLIKLQHFEIRSCSTVIPLIGCAASVGLGFITKSNVCFCMIPFLVWLLVKRIIVKDKLKDIVPAVLIGFAVVMSLVIITFVRNYVYWGDILASGYSSTLTTGSLNPVMLLLNAYKNWAINAGTSWGQQGLTAVGYFLAGLFGKNINDPSITWGGSPLENITFGSYQHDTATNPLFSYLILIVSLIYLIIVFMKRHTVEDKLRRVMGICLMAAVLLCYSFVRAQQYGTRLIMPGSVQGCLFIGIVFEDIMTQFKGKGEKIAAVLAAGIMMASFGLAVPVYLYQTEYLNYPEGTDKFQKYFAMDIWSYEPTLATCMAVERMGIKDVGIYIMNDPYQYPIWARFPSSEGYRVTEVIDVPEDAYNADFRIVPECIMTFRNLEDLKEGEYTYMGNKYISVFANYVGDELLLREDLINPEIDYAHILDE